jgi:RHS repeat-associated protein
LIGKGINVQRVISVIFIYFYLLLPSGLHAEVDYYVTKYISRNMEIGDPISASSGVLFFSMDFFSLGGPLPLNYSLTYRQEEESCASSFMIVNDPYIVKSGDVRVFNYGQDASMLDFDNVGGNWQIVESPVIYQLKETGPDEDHGYYYLMDPMNELVYIFKKDPDPYDHDDLMWIMDRNGNALTYTRDAGNGDRITGISDGLGRSLSFSYDIKDSDYSSTFEIYDIVTDHCGRTVTYTTDLDISSQCYAGVTDPNGAKTEFLWAEETIGNLTITRELLSAIKKPEGNIPYSWTYGDNPSGTDRWVTSQTDAYGNTTSISYSSEPTGNCPPEVTEQKPDGTERIYNHFCGNDSYGPPESLTDEAGKTATFTETDGRTTSVTDRMGDNIQMSYHAETGKIASITDAEGRTTTYTYTPQDQTFTNPENSEQVTFTFYNLTQITYPDGSTEQYGYDSNGNMTSHTDRGGRTWHYTYNNQGLPLTITNPLGGVTTYTYNPDGTRATSTDSDTGVTSYSYDACKRLTTITYPGGSTRQITYDNMDRITSLTDENGHSFVYTLDANGNLISTTDPAGNNTLYAYDLMDRLVSITDTLGKTTTYSYNSLGQITSAVYPDGRTITYEYDIRGRMTGFNRGGQKWQTGYDDGNVASSDATPSGITTYYQTNKGGFVTSITAPGGHTVNLSLDQENRVTSITDPLGRTVTYSYNTAGQPDSITLPVLGTLGYTYDDLGNLTRITDFNGNDWIYSYTPVGRTASLTDPAGHQWAYTYNQRGRISKTTYPDGSTCQNTYDGAGNLLQADYSSPAMTLTYTYDAMDRLLATNDLTLAYDAKGHIVNTVTSGKSYTATYDDNGRLSTVSYNNGAFVVSYVYNSTTGLLESITDNLTSAQVNFTYDIDEHMTGIVRSNGVNTTYTYDTAGRLVRIQHGSIIDIQYSIDNAGQITGATMTVPLDPASLLTDSTKNYTYDTANQITSTGYTYDTRGRLTNGGGHTFTWDGADRLTGIDSIILTYNGLHAPVSRTEGVTTINFHYNHAIAMHPLVSEEDAGTGNPLRYYVWSPSGRLLYMIDAEHGNQVYFYHFDNVGSTLALTNSAGTVTDSYAYTPYGQLLGHNGSNPQPFTFGGERGIRQETETLYQIGRRYYDASSARFISRDLAWPMGGPKAINPYQYAYQNPVKNTDIDGRRVIIQNPDLGFIELPGGLKLPEHVKNGKGSRVYDEINDIDNKLQQMEAERKDLLDSMKFMHEQYEKWLNKQNEAARRAQSGKEYGDIGDMAEQLFDLTSKIYTLAEEGPKALAKEILGDQLPPIFPSDYIPGPGEITSWILHKLGDMVGDGAEKEMAEAAANKIYAKQVLERLIAKYKNIFAKEIELLKKRRQLKNRLDEITTRFVPRKIDDK